MTRIARAVAIAAGLMGLVPITESWAQTAILNFATYPNGVQVPASDVLNPTDPTSGVMLGDQFAALGIHFNNTGG